MRELLKQYFNIAFLMGKPQDLPAGPGQLQVGVGLALLTYLLALSIIYGVERAFLQAVLDLGLTGIVLFLALKFTGHPGRFEQAYGGYCGASMFINLAALPIFLMRPDAAEPGATTMGALANFVLMVWGLSLLAHVIRHTFDVAMTLSVVLAFVGFLVLSSVITSLWPEHMAIDTLSSLCSPVHTLFAASQLA